MAKKVIWSPRLLTLKDTKLSKWCEIGHHLWIPFKSNPKSRICKNCKKEEYINCQFDTSLLD